MKARVRKRMAGHCFRCGRETNRHHRCPVCRLEYERARWRALHPRRKKMRSRRARWIRGQMQGMADWYVHKLLAQQFRLRAGMDWPAGLVALKRASVLARRAVRHG